MLLPRFREELGTVELVQVDPVPEQTPLERLADTAGIISKLGVLKADEKSELEEVAKGLDFELKRQLAVVFRRRTSKQEEEKRRAL